MVKKNAKKNAPAKKEDYTQLVSILSYLFVGIIWYFVDVKAQNSTTKFHVKQGIILFVIWLICALVLSIIPVIGGILAWLVQIVGVVLIIIGVVHALNGEKKVLPIIGGLAEKLTF